MPNNETSYILVNILRIMKKQKISQKQVLDELGLSSSAFADWKNGKTTSYIRYLPQIADILGVTEECLKDDETNTTYYGLNALSDNLIMADRKLLKNPNGLILSTPGSGISFAAKEEYVMNKTNSLYIVENIKKILNEQGITQAKFAELLNLKAGIFTDWQRGKSISYIKHLKEISKLLGVTQEELINGQLDENIKIPKAVYAKTAEHEIVNSLNVKDCMPSECELNKIANYIGCNIAFLYGVQNDSQVADLDKSINSAEMAAKIMAILVSLSASEPYRILQVQISRKIIEHLRSSKFHFTSVHITPDMLKSEVGINPKRVDFLCSNKTPDMRNRYDVGLNLSDLDRINEKYGVSFTYMLTGKTTIRQWRIEKNSNNCPIHKQISAHFREKILNGTIREGEYLPSTRALARDLEISIITTLKAYMELAAEGLITAVQGKGYLVTPQDHKTNPQSNHNEE